MKFYNFPSNKIDISEKTHVIQVRFVRAENKVFHVSTFSNEYFIGYK